MSNVIDFQKWKDKNTKKDATPIADALQYAETPIDILLALMCGEITEEIVYQEEEDE
jgi:hypothetical protein